MALLLLICSLGTITLFAVAGTFISALAFGILTYLLVVIGAVKRAHLGPAPLIECLLYGKTAICNVVSLCLAAPWAAHSSTT